MSGKGTTIISGSLLYPLRIGVCALIRHNGSVIRTPKVVSIRSTDTRKVCFETQNTNYMLLLPAASQPIEAVMPARVAA